MIAVRLRLPADPSPALRKLAEEYFDPAGLLRPEHYRSFDRALDVLLQAELDAVVYSDVANTSTGRMNSPKDWIWNVNSSAS